MYSAPFNRPTGQNMSKPTTANEIREAFLEFFRSKQHEIVPSAPVYLPSDDTLLFVNAGMVPFKEIFLGARDPDHHRVADTQKCIRVSGKHNDLEEVGVDTYHHTFFEMLGNWSFGDYYKKEAISWAWEFLTVVLELPKARLWASVYKDDDEAMELWKSETDIAHDHILRFDEKDNFWEMGDTGPCGPCSEIHFDGTPEGNATADMVNADLPEVLEIWNLVFIQYNRRADRSLEELPSKHVDTGMGFERLVATLQGKNSNYDSDVFMPYIEKLMAMSGKPYDDEFAVAMRVISDHVRTLSVAISDGVTPSNEGRGYVLRRLLRRAALYGRKLGFEQPFMTELFPVVVDRLGGAFPNIVERGDAIVSAIRGEEEGFVRNLDRGTGIFAELVSVLEKEGRKTVSGEEAFKLYDTYGFPIDMTQLMAREHDLSVDEDGFKGVLEERKKRDRQRGKATDGETADMVADLVSRGVKSEFVGYDRTTHVSEVLDVLGDTQVIIKETPFYGESGGQIGDAGLIRSGDAVFEVHDTQKPVQGIFLHIGEFKQGRFAEGDTVQAEVDAERRQRLQRHHSATHVMNYALREIVGQDVRQAGSYVGPDRLRFDFTAHEAVSPQQLDAIEAMVNHHLMQNDPVVITEMPLKDIEGSGIIAVFDEKYGEVVRVVDIGGYSKELCGGTHVQQAGDIGPFRIVSESSVSAGIRRLEAVCGEEATALTIKEHRLLKDLSGALSVTAEEVPERVSNLQKQVKLLEKELKQLAAKSALASLDTVLAAATESNGKPLIAYDAGSMDMDSLRNLLDAIRQKFSSGVILLGSENGGKACFVASVSPDLVEQGVNAGKLIGSVAKMCGGGGGGKPEKAQAGGKDGAKVGEAIAAVPGMIA
jgi:alanyl-tRNA synthetase